MTPCERETPHERRRLVLTGGLGGGKTAAFELIRQHFCIHVRVLNEAAGIVFGAGFHAGTNSSCGVRPSERFSMSSENWRRPPTPATRLLLSATVERLTAPRTGRVRRTCGRVSARHCRNN